MQSSQYQYPQQEMTEIISEGVPINQSQQQLLTQSQVQPQQQQQQLVAMVPQQQQFQQQQLSQIPQQTTQQPLMMAQAQPQMPPQGQQQVQYVQLSEEQMQRFMKPTSRCPERLYCDSCKQIQMTFTSSKIGKTLCGMTIAGVALFGICGFIPCLIDDCKDKEHFCNGCKKSLGTKEFKLCE